MRLPRFLRGHIDQIGTIAHEGRPVAQSLVELRNELVLEVEALRRLAAPPHRDDVAGATAGHGEQLLAPRCPECGPLDYDEVLGESGSAWPADDEPLICNLCGADVPRRAVCTSCQGSGRVPAVAERPCDCDLLASDDCELCHGTELRPVEVWEHCSSCDGEGAIALVEGRR